MRSIYRAVLFALAITVVVSTFTNDVVEEQEDILQEEVLPIPEGELLEQTMMHDESPKSAIEQEEHTKFFQNLLGAKAYSIVATDKITDVADSHTNFISAAKNFFLNFAKDGLDIDEKKMFAKEAKKGLPAPALDPEDQYKRIMVKIYKEQKAFVHAGSLGPYVLKAMDKSLHSNDGIIEVVKAKVRPKALAFGMDDYTTFDDDALDIIEVPLHKYLAALAKLQAMPYQKASEEKLDLQKLWHEVEPLESPPDAIGLAVEEAEELRKANAAKAAQDALAKKKAEEEKAAKEKISDAMAPGEKTCIDVLVKTGTEENAASAMHPALSFTMASGRSFGPYPMLSPVPAKGADDLLSFCVGPLDEDNSQLGEVTAVTVAGKGGDAWHLEKLSVRLSPYGTQWQSFEGDKWIGGGHGDQQVLHPAPEAPKKPWTVSVRARTGKLPESAGAEPAEVTVVGTKGQVTLRLGPGPRGLGDVSKASEEAEVIGEVTHVELGATAGAWFFSSFEVKVDFEGTQGKWQRFGSDHQWLAAAAFKPDEGFSFQGYPHAAKLELTPEHEPLLVKVFMTPLAKGEGLQHPAVTVHGAKGSKTVEVSNGAIVKAHSVELGELSQVRLAATSPTAAFVTAVKVKVGKGKWRSFGSNAAYLQAKPYKLPAALQGVPVADELTMEETTHKLEIKATTGDRPKAHTAGFVGVEVEGEEGTFHTVMRVGARGVESVVLRRSTAIGKVKQARLAALSGDAWFFANLELRVDGGEWQRLGPTHQWLQKKPYHQDTAAYEGHPVSHLITLRPRALTTTVSVTTAYAYHAECKGAVQVVLEGSTGNSSPLTLEHLPEQGKTKQYTFQTIDLGDVKGVRLAAQSTDNWLFSKLAVQAGKHGKLEEFGPSHQWVVQKPFEAPKLYSNYPFHESVLLTPAFRMFYLKYRTSVLQKKAPATHVRVVFMGALGNNTFYMNSGLPQPGQSAEHRFMCTDIGKFLGVDLIAENDEPWLVKDLQYRELFNQPAVKMGEIDSDVSLDGKDLWEYGDRQKRRHVPSVTRIQAETKEEVKALKGDLVTQNSEVHRQEEHEEEEDEDGEKEEHHKEKQEVEKEAEEEEEEEEKDDASKEMDEVEDEEEMEEEMEEKAIMLETSSSKTANSMVAESNDAEGDAITGAHRPAHSVDAKTHSPWVPLGSNEWLSGDVQKTRGALSKSEKAYNVEREQVARPIGTDCYCTGKSAPEDPRKTRYLLPIVGHVCAYHFKEDAKPWCFVGPQCNGRTLLPQEGMLRADCYRPVVPVKVSVHTAAKSGTGGKLSVEVVGMVPSGGKALKSQSVAFTKPLVAGKWSEQTVYVPHELKEIKQLKMRYKGANAADSFKWDDCKAQYAGGFTHSFSRDLESNGDWKELHHVKPKPPGTAEVTLQAADAQTNKPIEGTVDYTLLTPSQLGMSAKVIEERLHALRHKLLEATETKAKQSYEDKMKAVKRVVLSLGGPVEGAAHKYTPAGFVEARGVKGNKVTFSKLAEGEEQIVLINTPGYLFTFDRVKTKGAHSKVSKKAMVAKKMKHGQMIITLSWGEEPSDLDLYVVAPGKNSDAEIGGGKSGEASKLNAEEPEGQSINWMNTGDKDVFPYTTLDIDQTMGYGPETVMVHRPVVGNYKIYVDCYSCWGEDSFQQFKKSDAQVRVFDRFGLRQEFKVADALPAHFADHKVGPSKYWQVAQRTCHPPAALKGEEGVAKGFANRDNTWSFQVHNKFTEKAPA